MIIQRNIQGQHSTLKLTMAYTLLVLCIIIILDMGLYYKVWQKHQDHNFIRLEVQHEIIKSLIVNNLNTAFQTLNKEQENSISDHMLAAKEHIKNYVVTHNLPYLTFQELMNELFDQAFNYAIIVNDQPIISNGLTDYSNSIIKEYLITKDLLLKVIIQINPDSYQEQQAIAQINNDVLIIIVGSSIVFFISIAILLLVLNRNRRLQVKLARLELELANSIARSNNLSLFYKINEEFILKCYQYFKASINTNFLHKLDISDLESEYNGEYFPVPVATFASQKKINSHEIELSPIILDLTHYFNGYVAYYGANITLDIVNKIDKLVIPVECEIFNQIMMSMLANMLHFNKNTTSNRYIKLVFQEEAIICTSDGFRLDQNLLIRYSEKIFNDTANLYILSLGQIFILLKRLQLDYIVNRNNNSTTIEIKLCSATIDLNNNTPKIAKIIKLDDHKSAKDRK
ncbi:hypothetical protein [Candidatus Tisiphia endosymbiont of Beris chalybata]|uniref:hypothetical protein n=1 Tax=Candidatus Tisiphia endosymbiont of Beris chalybata TaxID=3066262 RepID=UPI00312C9DCD